MTDRRLASLDGWENEGGATKPRPATGPDAVRRLPRPARRAAKASENTAAGCRARAAADLVAAATMDTANGRRKFEHSATAWSERGDLLARLELGRGRRGSASEVSAIVLSETRFSADVG